MFFLESQSFAFLLAIRVIRLTLSRDYSHNSINTLPEKLCASLGRDSSSPPSSSFFVPFSSLLWTVLCLCWGFLEHLHLSFSLLQLSIQYFLPFAKSFFICEVCNYDLRLVPRPQWGAQSSTVVVSKATKNLNLIYPLVCTSLNKLEVVQIFPWKKICYADKAFKVCNKTRYYQTSFNYLYWGFIPFFQLKRLVCRSDQGYEKRYWRKVMVSGELFAYQSFVIRLLPQQINLSSQSNEEGCKHKYQ